MMITKLSLILEFNEGMTVKFKTMLDFQSRELAMSIRMYVHMFVMPFHRI